MGTKGCEGLRTRFIHSHPQLFHKSQTDIIGQSLFPLSVRLSTFAFSTGYGPNLHPVISAVDKYF